MSAGAMTLSTSSPVIADNSFSKTTFVLVHGTWQGGWVWRDVKQRLVAMGHKVETPTLTGCGEREHLSSPDVGLDTHIQDIVNRIEFEELENIILIGHSFSGLVITGVADRIKDKIKKIVFFDALVPRSGVMGAITPDKKTGALPSRWTENTHKFIDGYKMVFWDKYGVDMLIPVSETTHAKRLKKLITTHPAKTWTDQLSLKNGGWKGLSPSYIHCVGQAPYKSSEWMYGPAKTDREWQFLELDIPRNGMLTHPELVATTFVNLI